LWARLLASAPRRHPHFRRDATRPHNIARTAKKQGARDANSNSRPRQTQRTPESRLKEVVNVNQLGLQLSVSTADVDHAAVILSIPIAQGG
jgi:hypothetical protein